MKTSGLRPAAWEPRTRLVAAAVALVVVLGLALWWVAGADGRRAGAACDLLSDQQEPLSAVVDASRDAADRAEEAGDDGVLGAFTGEGGIDQELNSLRRWQSTAPRVDEALGVEEGDPADEGDSADVGAALARLTEATAELQRRLEEEPPAQVRDAAAALDERLRAADDLCASL